MLSLLAIAGILVAVTIGGSSTGVAFGPAVGLPNRPPTMCQGFRISARKDQQNSIAGACSTRRQSLESFRCGY
jgi:hypothetical protein